MWVWAMWFMGLMVGFLAFEIRAKVLDNPSVSPTLSRTIWHIQAKYPIFAFLLGLVVGGLAVHLLGLIPACHA